MGGCVYPKTYLLLAAFSLMMVSTASAKIIYVDTDALGANDGSSWADAYNYIQEALAAASSGDEIRVAEGVYKPDQGIPPDPDSGRRYATFQLISGVAMKGGYAGFGEPDANARDVEFYKSILSGDLNGDDPNNLNPEDLWGHPNRAENSYHVVTGGGTDSTAVLDGFTITGGNANVFESGIDSGGGMYNEYGSPTIINCTFIRNSAGNDGLGGGGGMYNKHSNPMLVNCAFVNNVADDYCGGGGIFNEYSNPILTNCTFGNNIVEYCGGGIYNDWSNPTLTNCTFSENLADYGGGAMWNGYGSFSTRLTNCMFSGNMTGNYGGGMFECSGGTITLFNCRFSANSGDEGGGIYNCSNGSLVLTNCAFSGNWADAGGGIYNRSSTSVTLANCTFAGNSAIQGNAMACDSLQQNYPSSIQITNCIFWDGENGIWNNDNSTITVTYSDVHGGWPGDGNIDADPCFVELGYWDANGVWRDGDYHLLPGSPCIDAGDPDYRAGRNETDLDGNPRVVGRRIDMGAYEYSPLISARIIPRTINLASESNWITAILRLGKDYNGGDIEPNSFLLEGEIEPQWLRIDEERQVVIAMFIREEVQNILTIGEVGLTITGRFTDGTIFEAKDVIIVINKGSRKSAKQEKTK